MVILLKGEEIILGVMRRRSIARILSMTHKPIKNLEYTLTGRKEFTSSYKIPVMGSLDAVYQVNTLV